MRSLVTAMSAVMAAATISGCTTTTDNPVSTARPVGDTKPTYSWQLPHARVMPTGDIQWTPEPFVFQVGKAVRYIDFENGSDDNDGLTKDSPWKHHPWDAAATGNSAAATDADTYVFKRGVTYRGVLMAKQSGSADEPIRLTSDPSWGEGEAVLAGSLPITDGWLRADAQSAPGFPEPERIWYQDIGPRPFSMWEIRDGKIIRIPIAREPNWTVTTYDDVKSNWYTWQNTRQERLPGEQGEGQGRRNQQERTWGIDAEHLSGDSPDAYKGGTVWTEYVSVMGQPYAAPIEAYDPNEKSIRFGGPWGSSGGTYHPIMHCRYYLENLPRFLDSPGEFYYREDGERRGRLFVRLPDDRDPNTAHLEIASAVTTIDIRDNSGIEISGLTFRFGNVAHQHERWWVIPEQDAATIRMLGNCSNITVRNCNFEHLPLALRARPNAPDAAMDYIAFNDNRIMWTDYEAINISSAGGTLGHVQVLRNYIEEAGHRPPRAGQAHTLCVEFPRFAEIAGNVLYRLYGAGVFVHGGKSGGPAEIPGGRILIHHNKVTDCLLTINDYGGIETWQGGPFYVYNNISGNPGGYWHWKHTFAKDKPASERDHATARFGFPYYLDGSFKNYLFNNIAWGKSNDLTSPLCNTTGTQEIIGFLNIFANNTFYNFATGGRRQAPQAGRCMYLGNIYSDISELYFRHADVDRSQDVNLERAMADRDHTYDTIAYKNNVFYGKTREFGVFQSHGPRHSTLESFSEALAKEGAYTSDAGVMATRPPLAAPIAKDFRPAPDSEAIDRGVKIFVPWGLHAVVGEWNFYRNNENPNRVRDDSWFMTENYTGREGYRFAPRYDLRGNSFTADSYRPGELEDWTDGVLAFNGEDQFLSIPDAELKRDIPARRNAGAAPASRRRTVDMDTNSFLIEAVLRIDPKRPRGAIVSKMDQTGYELRVTPDSGLELQLRTPTAVQSVAQSRILDDGKWHHVVVEVDRGSGKISFYVDGRFATSGGPVTGQSLSNTADFMVGKGTDGQYFAGELDFLRICRGTLLDADTTIDELYAWQFDGPFLRDFTSTRPRGKRDAGALERH